METKDIITLSGILVSLIVGFAGLIISFRNSKKTAFINSVTASRAKWIETVRATISEYCGLAFQIFQSNTGEKIKKMDQIQRLRFLLKLQLNPKDPFDSKIIERVDKIAITVYDKSRHNTEREIDELIALAQDLLKLEWEGVKEESKKGDLSKWRKRKMYNKYLRTKDGE